MTLQLPWPPTANNLHAVVRGRKILSRRGREYRGNALAAITEQRPVRYPATARLAVSLTLYPPDRRRRDISNSEKAAVDALVFAGVMHDDSQIDRLTIIRAEPRAGGALTVQIEEIPGNS